MPLNHPTPAVSVHVLASGRGVLFPWCGLLALNTFLQAISLVPAEAGSFQEASPSFRNEVMATLSRSGCNLGTCHGSANGKGGLKLSLRGQDPDLDYAALTRQFSSRRVNILDPDESLLLQKPLMVVPHEGGRRFEQDSPEYQTLKSWIANGLTKDPAGSPALLRLEVSPGQSTVVVNSASIQMVATACFSDGSIHDVTPLAVFDSSSLSIPVTRDGIVKPDSVGLTTVTVRYLNQQRAARIEVIADTPEFEFRSPAASNVIDQLVFAQLQRLRINPSALCDDSTFVRRAYLDLTGQLPPVSVSKTFLQSSDPARRSALIDELLASEEFVDQQTMRWADLLRAEQKTLDEKGLKLYHEWIHHSIADNKPINQMAAELISARGSTYTEAPANFYRALRTPEERAESTAQMFLGVRLTCAKCHNHPFDRWTQDDYYGWSNFFARIDYEIIENKRRDKNDKHEFVGEQIVKIKAEGEVKNVRTGKPADLRFLGENTQPVAESSEADRLQILAGWLSDASNRRFAATQANRIWYQLMGQGIVDPIDDFRATNPPVNPELLEAITDELIQSDYDTRHLMRLIMNSSTYQLSSVVNESNRQDEVCFSHVIPKRMTAEQTLDAISTVIGTAVPFGGHEVGTRATQLVGVRNGEFRYAKPEIGDEFLKLFGRPNRLQSCECERSNDPTLAQTLELVSGELIAGLLKKSDNRIAQTLSSDQTPEEFLQDLYWTAMSRSPTEHEIESLTQYIQTRNSRQEAFEDITWAVLNSNEFLLRH